MSLLLRPWVAADGSRLRDAVRSTPDLRRQLGDADLSTDGRAGRFIDDVLTTLPDRRYWVVEQDGRLLGNVGVSAINARHATGWVSYWLRQDARGHGYATRALATVTRWAFEHDLHRLELGHRVDNAPSCRVATRAGYPAEGIEREKLRYGTRRFDVEIHARLRTDLAPLDVEPIELDAG